MYSKLAVLIAMVAVPAAFAGSLNDKEYSFLFNQWKNHHNKNYATPEEEMSRFAVFKSNYDLVNEHNGNGHSWTMSLNEFSDLTHDEFKSRYVGGYAYYRRRFLAKVDNSLSLQSDLPSSVDWRTKGVVTPVKNQGQCGSCWAFSTTGSVEGITALKTGKLVSLSEQQLVDCSGAEGNMGCNGGIMDQAFQYIINNGGICSEQAYPYQAVQGTCKSSSCQSVATITGYSDVPQRNAQAFKAAIAQQPVSIAIEADQLGFQFYSGGVFTGTCGTNLDHGVLAVGYGTSSGQDYWLVKNSWGASWGDNGYIMLGGGSNYNNGAGQCGILLDACYPEKN